MTLIRAIVAAVLILAGGPALAQNLVIGTKLELNTLDPHFFSAFPTQSSHASLFDALVFLDKDLHEHPALATEWKVIDGTTWEFKLRRGVKFHDGSDFDADDVIATFKRVPNVPNSPNSFSQYMKSVKEIIKVDSHTLRMKTDAPNPTLSHDLSSVFIISKKYAEATTQDFNSGTAAIGTGPYKLVEWKNGERLVLQRFDGYWGGKAPWAQVTERILAKDSARVAALLSDEVDVIARQCPRRLALRDREGRLEAGQESAARSAGAQGAVARHQSRGHHKAADGGGRDPGRAAPAVEFRGYQPEPQAQSVRLGWREKVAARGGVGRRL
jgi:peptide/nickel transport system substrate-binding protein